MVRSIIINNNAPVSATFMAQLLLQGVARHGKASTSPTSEVVEIQVRSFDEIACLCKVYRWTICLKVVILHIIIVRLPSGLS